MNNCEQFVADLFHGGPQRAVEDGVDASMTSTFAWPINCAITLPGTPFACDQEE